MLAEEEATAFLTLLRLLAKRLDLEECPSSAIPSSESPVEKIARHLKAQDK